MATAEEQYLGLLWADEDEQSEEPLLAKSQVITAAQARPSYAEQAASGGTLTTLRPKVTVQVPVNPWRTDTDEITTEARDAEELRREVDGLLATLDARRAEHEAAVLAASKASEVVSALEGELVSLRQEAAALAAANPPQPERLHKVQGWGAEREGALAVAQSVAAAARIESEAAEAVLRGAEAELDFLAEARQALDHTVAADTAARRNVAEALRAREERAARGWVAQLEAQAARLEALAAEQEELRERKIGAAEEANERARERLAKGMERVRRNLAKGAAVLAAQNESRRNAVMGLKGSLAAVREEVGRKAALYRQLTKQRREVREAEFQDLIEQGLNPYEVYRRRDIESQVTRQRQAIRGRITARQVEVAAQLAREEEVHQRKLADALRERQVQLQFQREMGRTAVEARVDNYMRSHTAAGVPMLDPTGRLPVDPSYALVAKTAGFGTGRAPEALLDKMSLRHPDVRPKDMLIPTKYRDAGEDDDEDASDSDEGRPRPAMTERSGYTAVTGATGITGASGWQSGDGKDDGKDTGKGKGPDGWKQLQTRPLTKFERSAMEAAQTRHKDSIGQPKVMHGIEFGGDAFMATPSVVEFKDLEVGRTYTAKVAITNRSYAKNTFRVVEVPPEYGNVLEVSYALPGYLATGVSANITLTFTPKANEDIETAVELLAETGPFSIPVRCLTKKAACSVSCGGELDFGPGVTLGESMSNSLILINDGALDVEYEVEVVDEGGADGALPRPASVDGTALLVPPFTLSPCRGPLPGYGRTTLPVVFRPTEAAAVARTVRVHYRALHQKRLYIPTHDITLHGVGRDVPIFLERSLIDFRCVMVEHTYREKLVVRNGGRTAMKVSVGNRPDVSDYFTFSPDFGFVQAGEAFPITVVFKPKAALLQQCARFLTEQGGSVIEVPMKVTVPDQKLPVTFTLRAHVTTTDILFSPPTLDFGACVMAEDTGLVLRVTNPSALPHTLGFVNLPPGIRIAPNDGFGFILPGETVERIVSYQPPIPGPQSLTITAKTLAGRTFTLPASALGVQPGLSISHNKISFPATPVNDVTTVSVVMRNATAVPQAFEFGVPKGSGLTFIPHVGEVAPGSSKRIQIDYAPQMDDEMHGEDASRAASPLPPPTSQQGGAGTSKAVPLSQVVEEEGDEGGEEEGEGYEGGDGPSQDPTTWYRWRHHNVPCYIRPPADGALGAGGPASDAHPQALHLNIVACAVQPDIVLRTELTWVKDKRCFVLDFGPVPVGQRVTRSIELFNQGVEAAQLSSQPLDTREIFAVVNAWRTVKPGGLFRSLLAFTPSQRTEYLQMLTVASPRTRVRIALRGQGIAPELRLEPAELMAKGLDLGDVYKGETSEAKFSVTNVCPFPLSFSMRLHHGTGHHHGHDLLSRPPFFCRPAEGTLAQGESCDVTVVFAPSAQRPYYTDVLQVYVPNQQEQLLVPLRGRCWEEGGFVAGPTYPTPVEDPFLEGQLAHAATAAIAAQAAAGTLQGPPSLEGSTPGSKGALPLLSGTPLSIGGPGTPSPIVPPPLGVIPMAPAPPTLRTLTLNFTHPLFLGEGAAEVFEVGSLKSAAYGGAAGEFILDELPQAARDAGWSVDPPRVSLAAGDKKPVTAKYFAPREAHAGMAALFGHSEHMELRVGATLKGCSPPPPEAAGRRMVLVFRVLVQPRHRPLGEAAPQGVIAAPSEEEVEAAAAAAAAAKGPKAGAAGGPKKK